MSSSPLPTASGFPWPLAKSFAREVCSRMAADNPDLYLIKMTKALRETRIFLDYLRNDTKSTAVAPLSPRARPHCTCLHADRADTGQSRP